MLSSHLKNKTTWNEIKKHIGQHYTFRIDGMIMSGFFCGIGEYDNDHGMIFISTEYGWDEDEQEDVIQINSCLLIHPLKIKCTLYSDMLVLRKSCRNLFKQLKLTNSSNDIYHPSFEIKEITNEKRVKTKG